MKSGTLISVTAFILMVGLFSTGALGLYSFSVHANPQSSSGQTSGPIAQYLGYLPKGYATAALLPNAPAYPCPSNFNSTQCAQFKASCGNGVCDPNETCSTCPIDCGVPQGLSCDPYTGRASGLGGICELTIPYSNTNPGLSNPVLNPPTTPGSTTG